MKPIIRSILISFTVLLFILSPAPCRAEVKCKIHNLHEMYSASPEAKLKVTDSNQTGRSVDDGIVYTCSDGAKFFYYGVPGELAIFLNVTDAQVTTTKIQNLKQIIVTYLLGSGSTPPSVAISTNGVDGWKDLVAEVFTPNARKYTMPSVGDYYVLIKRNGSDVYIKALEYCQIILPDCPNCFIYRPE